jgi:hypothetical protein
MAVEENKKNDETVIKRVIEDPLCQEPKTGKEIAR